MKTNFSLLFYLKKSKNYQNGPVAIYMRITIDGKRSEITTGRSCEPKKWIVATGRINGKKEDARSLNAYLTDLQIKVYEAHRQLSLSDKLITAEAIRDRFQGKEEKQTTLIKVHEEFRQDYQDLSFQ